jgi:hypothetical protein
MLRENSGEEKGTTIGGRAVDILVGMTVEMRVVAGMPGIVVTTGIFGLSIKT